MVWVVFVAGALAPLFMTVGLFVWDERWRHTAVGLNALKGCFGGLIFAVIVAATGGFSDGAIRPNPVLWLVLSSVLGIVIADTWWLIALKTLGAGRMIAVDAVKPILAIAFGAGFLGDVLPPLAFAGVFATAAGVYLLNRHAAGMSLVEEHPTSSEAQPAATVLVDSSARSQPATLSEVSEAQPAPRRPLIDSSARSQPATPSEVSEFPQPAATKEERRLLMLKGYGYAAANVVLDVYAATLTVANRGRMGSAQVNLVRFGFAGLVLAPAAAAMRLRRRDPQKPADIMSRQDWAGVLLGIIFVTVLTPLISVWVMFRLPLAVAVTLNSLSPIYSLPVAHFYQHKPFTTVGVAGALLTTGGVAALSLAMLGS